VLHASCRALRLRDGRLAPVSFLNPAAIASKTRVINKQYPVLFLLPDCEAEMIDILKEFFEAEEWEVKKLDGQIMAFWIWMKLPVVGTST
jgi:hypothetical protein